ncbi:MAG: hypothetical protein WC490_05755 [Candidatus Margulisiibacteriota bacterium]
MAQSISSVPLSQPMLQQRAIATIAKRSLLDPGRQFPRMTKQIPSMLEIKTSEAWSKSLPCLPKLIERMLELIRKNHATKQIEQTEPAGDKTAVPVQMPDCPLIEFTVEE